MNNSEILRVREVIRIHSEIRLLKSLRCRCKVPTLKLAISSTSRLALQRKLCHSIIPVIHQGEQIAGSRRAGREGGLPVANKKAQKAPCGAPRLGSLCSYHLVFVMELKFHTKWVEGNVVE